jgi:hypothetical protein
VVSTENLYILRATTFPVPIFISNIDSQNSSLDEAKKYLGELWLPTYVPHDYLFTAGIFYSSNGVLGLLYKMGTDRAVMVSEINNIQGLIESKFKPGTVQQVTVNSKPALLGVIVATTSYGTETSALVVDFLQGSLEIMISVTPADSLSGEELIKVAESLVEY